MKSKILLLIMAISCLNSPAFAASLEPGGTPLRKLQRGFLNAAFSPIELLYSIKKENQQESFPPGWALGIGKGSFATVERASVGIFEILTFPFQMPEDYQPLIQPEFAWQKLDEFNAGNTGKNLKTKKAAQ